jgi:hypothetical protein
MVGPLGYGAKKEDMPATNDIEDGVEVISVKGGKRG